MTASAGMAPAMTTTQLFDSIAIRIDGPKAWDTALSITWKHHRRRRDLPHGAEQRRADPLPHRAPTDGGPHRHADPAAAARLLLAGAHDGIDFAGDPATLPTLLALTDDADPSFPIVTP